MMQFFAWLRTATAVTVVLASAVAAQSTPAGAPVPTSAPTQVPTLVVLITIDQLRPDYLDRYAPQLTGGLARLARGGAVFTKAYQDHATTETAPGHASTLSGRFPRSTGIVLNALGVGDANAPLINSTADGASPARFRGTTLIDWMQARDSRSRALSVSRKDRAAILPIGRSKQAVFWYTPEGNFTTSKYYGDTLPTWVERFNARRLPARYTGQSWTPVLPDSAYQEPDSVAYEGGGTDFVFPHVMPSDTVRAVSALPSYPWMDEVTVAAALEGVNAMQLGAGPAPDLLAVSLSTTDAIGHRYGPDSKEIHDQVLRVDRMLGVFLDSLFKLRDSTRVVIALTADHGVTPFPELTVERTHTIVQHIDLSNIAQEFQRALAQRQIPADAFQFSDAMLFVDRGAFEKAQVNADSVIAAFAAQVKERRGVARVDEPRALAQGDTVNDAIARRWLHSIPADFPVALVVTLDPGNVWGSGTAAQHGQPSDADAHVPLILYGPRITPGRYDVFARVVDIGPTLAAMVGVRPTEAVDGSPLAVGMR